MLAKYKSDTSIHGLLGSIPRTRWSSRPVTSSALTGTRISKAHHVTLATTSSGRASRLHATWSILLSLELGSGLPRLVGLSMDPPRARPWLPSPMPGSTGRASLVALSRKPTRSGILYRITHRVPASVSWVPISSLCSISSARQCHLGRGFCYCISVGSIQHHYRHHQRTI